MRSGRKNARAARVEQKNGTTKENKNGVIPLDKESPIQAGCRQSARRGRLHDINLVRRDGGVHRGCGDPAVSEKPIARECSLKGNKATVITQITIGLVIGNKSGLRDEDNGGVCASRHCIGKNLQAVPPSCRCRGRALIDEAVGLEADGFVGLRQFRAGKRAANVYLPKPNHVGVTTGFRECVC